MSGLAGLNLSTCFAPFLDEKLFANSKGFVEGRTCAFLGNVTCCVPCPLTDWVYPDSFNTMGLGAQWIAVVSTVCCVFLLLSWAFLPVEKTSRHYLSICLCCAIMFMNLGFVVPLAAQPNECADAITPNGMKTSSVCAASGALLILGGWAAVMWVFLRSLSLHLQICWQVVVGRTFMWASQVAGWGIPLVAVTLALIFSGVSFRFGSTCHINHENSLADLWVPLLVFAGITILIQFTTFGYCIKVYLASLADNSASTEGSGLPSYSNSIRTMTPKQAYRRVRRVIQLQWRGIAIVMLIIADVIFFSVIFVFQDNTVQAIKEDPMIAFEWLSCTFVSGGDKSKCMTQAEKIRVPQSTIGAVLFLLAMNGIWLVAFVGRWSMVTGWLDLIRSSTGRNKREFVSVDARLDDLKKDQRSYEMLSRDSGFPHGSGKTMDDVVTPSVVSPVSPVAKSPLGPSGRRTPDYFGQTARYHAPDRSFSSPRPPQQPGWEAQQTYARPQPNMSSGFDDDDDDDDQTPQQPQQYYQRQHSRQQQRYPQGDRNGHEDPMNPLGMNRI